MPKKDYLRYFLDAQGKQFVDDIKASEKTLEQYRKRYEHKKQRTLPWQSVGVVEQVMPVERGVRFACTNGVVEVCWIATDTLRVQFAKRGTTLPDQPTSFAVINNPTTIVPFESVEGPQALELRSGRLVCRIGKAPFRIGVETLEQQVICLDNQGISFREDGSMRLSLVLQPDESCYGLGERTSGLNLRGKRYKLWNADPGEYSANSDPFFCSVPFYLGMHANGVYGVFWDNPSRGIVDLTASERDELYFESEAGPLCYYLFLAEDIPSILGRYTELTGRVPLPPLWSLSYQESQPRGELSSLEKLRAKNFPSNVINLDMRDFLASRPKTGLQPSLKSTLENLKKQGFKIIGSIQPGVPVHSSHPLLENGRITGAFLQYPDTELVSGVNWSGSSYFADFGSKGAQAWWTSYLQQLFDLGLDGLQIDNNEPSIFTSEGIDTLPDGAEHHIDNQRYDHADVHNVFSLLMAKSSVQIIRKTRSSLRPFYAGRAGYAGIQGYGASWLSDLGADWDQLHLLLRLALNMSLSGLSLIGTDIPINESGDPELYARWLQAVALMPFFRSNVAPGNNVKGLWFAGAPYEVINNLTVQLRNRLMPYLYSVIAQCKEYGWPILRPLFMLEPENVKLRSVDDCYMIGASLLVAPVIASGVVQRTLYLPTGVWYDYWTNETYEGGNQVTVPASLERLPLFIKAGTVLPLWPEMNLIGEKPIETLLYRVYPGEHETVVYEDRGEGLDYEQGDYRWIYLTTHWEENQLIINRRVAGRYNPSYKNHRIEIVGFEAEPSRVQVDWQAAPLWFYDDGILDLTLESFQRIEVTRKSQYNDETLVRRPW